MQLRRALLLFALVLGLSAVVAALVPRENRDEDGRDAPAVESPASTPGGSEQPARVRFAAESESTDTPTREVPLGARASIEVVVSAPGDVVVEGLGLRASANRLTPARFELLARPSGRYDVTFHPVGQEPFVVGRVAVD